MCLDAALKRDFIGFHIEIKLLHLHYISFSLGFSLHRQMQDSINR
jgi:hypothetical protein